MIPQINPEEEVERFLKVFLPGTFWENRIKAVGGYPRDQYLRLFLNDPSIEAKDLDLIVVEVQDGAEKATHFIFDHFKDAKPDPISTPRQMGAGYPIWQITFKEDVTHRGESFKTQGAVIEFADTMADIHPEKESRQRITRPGTLKEDIARRDFLPNMLLKDMTTGEFEDPTGQSKFCIEKGIIRGHPDYACMDEIFDNDPLRMIRLARFSAKFGWSIPLTVLRSAKRQAARIKIVSAERIMGELEKVMVLGKLEKAIRIMSVTGLLKFVMPEIEALKGVKQNPKWHNEGDVFEHTMMVLKWAPAGVESQMAALLHDIGKPATTELINGEIRSHKHEDVGADMAESLMKRLKFKNELIDNIKVIIRNHMRPHHLMDGNSKAVRKFIRDIGENLVESVLTLAEADELGRIPSSHDIPALRKRIEEIRQKEEVKKEPILNGLEIMALLNISTGTEVGRAKKLLIEIGDDFFELGKVLTKEVAKEELIKKFDKV